MKPLIIAALVCFAASPAVAATNMIHYTDGTVELVAVAAGQECDVPVLSGDLGNGLAVEMKNGKILDRIVCVGHAKDPDWTDSEEQPMADFFFGGTHIEGHNMPEAICKSIGQLMEQGKLISAYGGVPAGLDCYPSRKKK